MLNSSLNLSYHNINDTSTCNNVYANYDLINLTLNIALGVFAGERSGKWKTIIGTAVFVHTETMPKHSSA
jgi:lipocalin